MLLDRRSGRSEAGDFVADQVVGLDALDLDGEKRPSTAASGRAAAAGRQLNLLAIDLDRQHLLRAVKLEIVSERRSRPVSMTIR